MAFVIAKKIGLVRNVMSIVAHVTLNVTDAEGQIIQIVSTVQKILTIRQRFLTVYVNVWMVGMELLATCGLEHASLRVKSAQDQSEWTVVYALNMP